MHVRVDQPRHDGHPAGVEHGGLAGAVRAGRADLGDPVAVDQHRLPLHQLAGLGVEDGGVAEQDATRIHQDGLHSAGSLGAGSLPHGRRVPGWASLGHRSWEALDALRGQHRTPIPDLMLAAIAHAHSAVVLHYDSDYERVAEVTGQPHEWIIPQGAGHGVRAAGP